MVARHILIELFWAKQLHWGSACFRCFEDFPVLNFNGCGNISRESHLAGDVRMLHTFFILYIFVMSGRSFEPRRNSEASDAQNLSAFSLPAGRHSLKAEIFQRRVPSFVPNALECLAGCHVFL